MKKIIVMLVSVMSIYCLIGCGSNDAVGEASNDSQQESIVNEDPIDKPTDDSTSKATTESTSEAATESTEESTTVVYEGIDMESTLPGEEWIATFVGVIEEPKVVIFNDETGRKEIVEEGTKVAFNPDTDVMAVYLPEGFEFASKVMGLEISKSHDKKFGYTFDLDPEVTRESKFKEAAVYVENNGEEIALGFMLQSE